jgi:hypothetical protein
MYLQARFIMLKPFITPGANIPLLAAHAFRLYNFLFCGGIALHENLKPNKKKKAWNLESLYYFWLIKKVDY